MSYYSSSLILTNEMEWSNLRLVERLLLLRISVDRSMMGHKCTSQKRPMKNEDRNTNPDAQNAQKKHNPSPDIRLAIVNTDIPHHSHFVLARARPCPTLITDSVDSDDTSSDHNMCTRRRKWACAGDTCHTGEAHDGTCNRDDRTVGPDVVDWG